MKLSAWKLLLFVGAGMCIVGVRSETASCLARCDEDYFPGKPCYCNAACDQYENCCYDYYELCAPDMVWVDEWVEMDNHTYKFFHDQTVTASEANKLCQQHGALLVSINSQSEMDFVGSMVLRKRTLGAFIGGIKTEGNTWQWADTDPVAMPYDDWNEWYDGHPAGGACTVITNYKFWDVSKFMLASYMWRSFSCDFNVGKTIQGYICEASAMCSPNPCLNNGTCSYVGELVTESGNTCQCEQGFLGEHCQYPVTAGELWTRCGDTTLTETEGVIASPLYPLNYPSNVRCDWLIEVDADKTVSLFLESLDLEESKNCFFDRLSVYDGDSFNDSMLAVPLCGQLNNNSSSSSANISQLMSSSSNRVLVSMVTDNNVENKGFRLSYSQDACGLGTGDSGCGTRGVFTADCGTIEISQASVDSSACHWSLRAQPGQLINVTFTDFNIPETDQQCSESHLAVYVGETAESSMLGRFCGQRFPWSLQSTGSELFIVMNTNDWQPEHRIKLHYQVMDGETWRRDNPEIVLSARHGTWSSNDYPVQVVTSESESQEWVLRAPIGERLLITWSTNLSGGAHFQGVPPKMFPTDGGSALVAPIMPSYYGAKIYDGYSQDSGSLLSVDHTHSGEVLASSFQARLRLTKPVGDTSSSISVTYTASAWIPELSGCYRPWYYHMPSSGGTENNYVTSLEPVVLMVSDDAQGSSGYDAGLYCKWLIKAGGNTDKLEMDFLDASIPPVSEHCDYDGFVIYDGNSTSAAKYGPFCGTASATYRDLVSSQTDVLVVFYSDNRPGTRRHGKVRTVITSSDMGECRVDSMDTATSDVLTSQCGAVLSPNFPALVDPGQWFWTIQGPPGTYFDVYVFYIRGPGLPADEDCRQSFTVLEISKDSGLLRQNEGYVLRVCADTDLFVPNKRLKMPPHQKVGLELNTLTSGLAQRWQFKVSYTSDTMAEPQHLQGDMQCPEEYVYYRQSCYRYYPWVLRHYQQQYSFTETWQASLQQCETENATLVSVRDEAEADFLKYTFSHTWFWDPAASYQQNHRIVFLGLHNKYGRYEWTNGSALGYADWYVPAEEWLQPVLHEDTVGTSFINLLNAQPTADLGSTCTALIVTSPFRSLNWAKIPCDYPLFRAGTICKKPAINNEENDDSSSMPPPVVYAHESTTVCPDDWLMVSGRCLHLYTDYTSVRAAMATNTSDVIYLAQHNASAQCSELGGRMALVTDSLLDDLLPYFDVWRVTPDHGNIWVDGGSDVTCAAIRTWRTHPLDEVFHRSVGSVTCDSQLAHGVLCETDTIERVERCGLQEFVCDNAVCISVDGVCDGRDDCLDGSDERDCGCGVDTFSCDNDKCIPISLYCDFRDDCEDNSDETACELEICQHDEFRCDNGQCVPGSARCDFTAQCVDGSDEADSLCEGHCQGMLCYSGKCLHPKLRSDLISDCPGTSSEDELQDHDGLITFFDLLTRGISISNASVHVGCEDGGQSQCRADHQRCFSRADTCVHDTERVDGRTHTADIQASCRDGAHLRSGCQAAQCPGMYHCRDSYCLPYRKLCDGRADCPLGDDELGCDNYSCPGMLKCRGGGGEGGQCVPHHEVCDGVQHCPQHGDDERYCQMTDVLCSTPGCNCTGHVVTCSNLDHLPPPNPNNTDGTRSLRALVITGSRLQLTTDSFRGLHWLGKLTIKDSEIGILPAGIFSDLRNLFQLDLGHNDIRALEPQTFAGLGSLTHLYVNDNELMSLSRVVLEPLTKLQHLDLRNNELPNVDQDTFRGSKALRVLHTDDYKFCCIADQVETCTPEADEFSSCEDLMANYALQVSIWVLGTMAFLGNGFVIGWRIMKDRSKPASFFIINLGCSDFLMGVYLLIIASVDVYYRGSYIVHAESWRTSTLCQAAGVLAMLSSEVSVFMLTVITLERVFSIVFPLKFGQMRMKNARIVAGCGWFVCLCLSVLPATRIDYFGDSFFGRTGVCLPFQVNNNRLPGWEYSVFIFLVLNLISFVVIFLGYVAIFMTVKSSVKQFAAKSTNTTDEYALAKKLALIVVTDFICWVPIIMIGFAALGGAVISPQVSAWIAVFVLPLNSSINPLLYTMSALDCGRKRRSNTSTASTRTKSTRVVGWQSESSFASTAKEPTSSASSSKPAAEMTTQQPAV